MATTKRTKSTRKPATPKTENGIKGLSIVDTKGHIDENLKRLNLPPMLAPSEVPIGASVTGKIINIVPSFSKDVDGYLMHLQHPNTTEFVFPLTGTIQNAVFPGLEDEEIEEKAPKVFGKTIQFKRLADGSSKKHPNNPMFMFDVFMSE